MRHPALEGEPDGPDLPAGGTAPDAARVVRRSAAAVRDAQAVRRRLERLADGAEVPGSSQRLLEDALLCVQRLTDDLAYHHRSEQRRLQESLRRRGPPG